MSSNHDRPALIVIDVQEGSFAIPGFKIDGPTEFLARVSALISTGCLGSLSGSG
jgi:nicotinamidase-related amidase